MMQQEGFFYFLNIPNGKALRWLLQERYCFGGKIILVKCHIWSDKSKSPHGYWKDRLCGKFNQTNRTAGFKLIKCTNFELPSQKKPERTTLDPKLK